MFVKCKVPRWQVPSNDLPTMFDPERDLMEVAPDLSTNLNECIATGLIPSAADTEDFDKPEGFEDIRPYAEDAIQIAMAVKAMGKSLKATPTDPDPNNQTV